MASQLTDSFQALKLVHLELPGHTIPKPLPPNQSRLSASNDVLRQHGLPPRPDKENLPKEYAAWEHTVSRALNFIRPTFTHLPSPQKEEYSGATNVPLKDDSIGSNYKFTQVTGSWLVSRPSPQNWAFKEHYWLAKEFFAETWIGIDDKNFRVGLAQNCTTSYHQDTEYIVYPWYQFFKDGKHHRYRIHGLAVRPGDLVRVYASRDHVSKQSKVSFYNESSATYSSFFIDDVPLEGDKAFWIVADPYPKKVDPTLSYLGVTNFFDCYTNQVGADKMGEDVDTHSGLNGAAVLNIVEAEGTTSTASVREDDILTITSEVREYREKVEP